MSSVNTLSFPELIFLQSFEGNFNNYFNAVYEIFDAHFIKAQPRFAGVRVSAPRYPEVDGRSRTFYHITHEGEDEQNREPDIRRMERIRFPRFKIETHPHSELLVWEKQIGSDTRIHILNKDQCYLLVLNKRKDYLLLWTAFWIERKHTLDKKLKEYEAYIKTKTA